VRDYPFTQVVKTADLLIQQGHDVYQKFTCAGCGRRLTMDVKNTFYEEGTCDRCEHVTDIRKDGCNYLVVMHA
jgi:hypothetical protein